MNAKDMKSLKFQVMREHEYICAYCGTTFHRGLDLHEWLVKRSAVPREQQHHIFNSINCVPLCRECHMLHGQARITAVASFAAVIARTDITPLTVAAYYTYLRHDIGLSLPPLPEVPITDDNREYLHNLGKGMLVRPASAMEQLLEGQAAERVLVMLRGPDGGKE